MTTDTMVKAMQAHFEDESAAFKLRIQAAIPVGIELFASENQWEFLDIYWTTTAAVDGTTGKTIITMPAAGSWFKPVHIWTDTNREVGYIDRKEWAQRQQPGASTQPPYAYTVIGQQLFLDRPATGATIYMIYTRTNKNIDLPDIPFEYHGAVLMGAIWFLTPAMVIQDGQRLPNPAREAAWASYQERIRLAMSQEMSQKGRTRRLAQDPASERRSLYR